MTVVELVGLDHVQLAMPVGREADARRFYEQLLGMREVEKLDGLRVRGGCWFLGPGVTIHLGIDQRFIAGRKAHPALVVADLQGARTALESAGAPVHDDESAVGIRRVYTEDPFGNRIELVDARDAGFTDLGVRARHPSAG
jgi:catechol 2,3-dioxygenase-like lactoylglutathione lyase family enzyme